MDERSEVVTHCTCGVMVVTAMIMYIYLKLEKNIGFSFIAPGIFIPNLSKLQET